MKAWKVLETYFPFKTDYLTVQADRCRLPNGGDIEHYTTLLRPWATIVAVTEKNEVVLVRQYRHSIRQVMIELPAGVIDPGETPEEGVRRELLEETGYAAGELVSIGAWYTDTGKVNCHVSVFFGRVLGLPRAQHLDADEEIEILLHPGREVLQMIRNGEIRTAAYVAAILKAADYAPEVFR